MTKTRAYMACVPHAPLLSIQARTQNPGLWAAYEACIAEFDAFDPELVIVFGGNHYQGIHLDLAPTFLVGQIAEAIDDCGGMPGKLDVPMDSSIALANALVDAGFDIAISYSMVIDHGFTNVLGNFLKGNLAARPVIPVHINSLSDPRPTFQRCCQFGEAVGRFAATLGKRVAFLGSGGLSHETASIFPQYATATTTEMRDYMVHGDASGALTQKIFNERIIEDMNELSRSLVDGSFVAPWINDAWDQRFLALLAAGDLAAFDEWTDAEVIAAAGYGGSEIRMWIAAAAAAKAAGAPAPRVDYYSGRDTVAVGAAVAHAIGA